MAANNIKEYINQDNNHLITPIKYLDGDKECEGYLAELLPELCSIYLKARRDNKLTHNQMKLAIQSEILLESFAKVGILTIININYGIIRYFLKNRELLGFVSLLSSFFIIHLSGNSR